MSLDEALKKLAILNATVRFSRAHGVEATLITITARNYGVSRAVGDVEQDFANASALEANFDAALMDLELRIGS
jgi:hypothetical protein